jgi:hypothetical protein
MEELANIDNMVEAIIDASIESPKAYKETWQQVNKTIRALQDYNKKVLANAVEAGVLIMHPYTQEVAAHTRNTHKKEWLY